MQRRLTHFSLSAMSSNLAPIILFVYNRPEHTRLAIESLKNCKLASKSILYIFSDAPKNENNQEQVKSVRKQISNLNGFKEVIIEYAKQNKGLAKSVIEGVSSILEKYESAIILEDDLLLSESFLEYMNKALFEAKSIDQIFTVSGYSFPVKIPTDYKHELYLGFRSSSWGWGTWAAKWMKANWESNYFEDILSNRKLQKRFNRAGNDYTPMLIKQLNGKIDSWAVRWAYNQMMNNAYTLFPKKSLVKNIGLDGSGTHSKKRKRYVVELNDFMPDFNSLNELELNEEINRRIKKLNSLSIYRRFRNFISFGIY